ncbi:DUF2460 domain-containing protein [Candidatus Mesenet endosymbiont of Agriotes lineatus]|uniref:DUF2460 domain-containing protein n=1 Tax=Candidatus Mesenet endosymbiont of Agriotes lineatus TaxID=3077948 RepID=UPI0030CC4414
MEFTEMRFPEDISYGSTGGPEFSTDIITTHNGHEQRNINWSVARAKYNVAYGVKSDQQLSELIAFFRARHGKAIGFRFKDWSDYKTTGQKIGIGDGSSTTFQLVKRYESGGSAYVRVIKKPTHETVKIYFNNIIKTDGYSVDHTTGKITFIAAPSSGVLITADFEFDVPVRFDTDYLSASIDNYGSSSWNDIQLIEIKSI